MAKSTLERLAELDSEREKLMASALPEAIQAANAAADFLSRISGKNWQVIEVKESGRRPGTRHIRDEPCRVCGFKTTPPHDARKHRAQGKNKKQFTAAELRGLGLEKVLV